MSGAGDPAAPATSPAAPAAASSSHPLPPAPATPDSKQQLVSHHHQQQQQQAHPNAAVTRTPTTFSEDTMASATAGAGGGDNSGRHGAGAAAAAAGAPPPMSMMAAPDDDEDSVTGGVPGAVAATSKAEYIPEAYEPRGCYTRDELDSVGSAGEVVVSGGGAAAAGIAADRRSGAGSLMDDRASEINEPDDAQGLAGTNLKDEAHLPPPLEPVAEPWFILTPLDTIPAEANILEHDVNLLHQSDHNNPFSVLGAHHFSMPSKSGGSSSSSNTPLDCVVLRLWRKDSAAVSVRMLPETCFTIVSGGPSPSAAPPTPSASSAPSSSASSPSSSSASLGFVAAHKRCDWLWQLAFRVTITEAGKRELKSRKEDSTTTTTTGAAVITTENELLRVTRPIYEMRVKYNGDASGTEYPVRDAYNFGMVASEYDLRFFQQGSCWHVDNLMGSHLVTIDRVKGVQFLVWAPAATIVSVVGDWNQWDGRAHPMRHRCEFGVWELFIPDVAAGEKYGYRIKGRSGTDRIKIDPYAQEFENPPATASVISSCDDAYKPESERFKWTDEDWMARRTHVGKQGLVRRQPMSIYEVHLPSWMRGDNNSYLGYRELAHRLIEHVKSINFTHVEFLPLAHHPFEGSWGYQISGQFAPYSRLGNPDDLKYLINELHKNDIGVFIDFVPAHFVKDTWGLVHYDGEPCYEYADPREGEHKGWGTMMFNFRRSEVRSFLLGAAYHWLRRYHVDGMRLDAVSSMIYKNHCRDEGDWIPNEYGGHANIQAISLLQELNWVVHHEFPGVCTMAEESTSWPGVTDQKTGLGFDLKWDLGWMNDTLSYLCTPAAQRCEKHQKLTFRGLYLGNEKWVLPLSHDEVVSGKGSLLDKCGYRGTSFNERLSVVKALYGFQVGQPGRPLLFMGGEFAQGREWGEQRSIDWHEAEEHPRKQVMQWVSDLFQAYRTEEALYAGDDETWNFQWTDCDNAQDSLVAWLRKHGHWTNDILVVINFSNQTYRHYPVGVPHGGEWSCLLNSDDWKYGGAMIGLGNGKKIKPSQGGRLGWPYCLWIDVPPSSCIMFKAPQLTREERLAEERENNADEKHKGGGGGGSQNNNNNNNQQQQQQHGPGPQNPTPSHHQ